MILGTTRDDEASELGFLPRAIKMVVWVKQHVVLAQVGFFQYPVSVWQGCIDVFNSADTPSWTTFDTNSTIEKLPFDFSSTP